MKIAETVTFGGSGLDRAAELRGQAEQLQAQGDARAILVMARQADDQGDTLVRVPMDHPVMADAATALVLLGRDDGAPVFAADLSGMDPGGFGLPKRSILFWILPNSVTQRCQRRFLQSCARS